MEAVEFRDVSFSYAGCEREALKNINLAIHPSEFTVICGKSGCGKSTLLRQLKKNLIPYGYMEGQVLCFGTKVEELEDRESAGDIGFVQQNPDNQIVTDKVWHELAFGLESLGYDNGTMKRKVAEMASFFGMQTWFEKDIRELSGGQKQLLNLSSIMVLQPRLLILDEPTAQLDPIAASDFLHTLEKINRELGTTILISEHRLEEIFPMVDRVVVMEEGRILIHDTPREVATFLALGENKNDMFHGLPSVTKLYSLLTQKGDCPSSTQKGDCPPSEQMSECPLSVREGRLWLEELLSPRLEEASKAAGKRECFKQPIHPEDSGTGDIRATSSETEPIKHAPERSHRKRKPEEYAIYIEDLWFRYQRTGSDILRGVNLKVERGEWLCLLGGNGVGKSTTLKALCGLIKPYRGYAMADGIRVEKKNEGVLFDHCLSMLPQNPQAMFTEITVEEELLEALYSFRLSDQERIRRVESMLAQMELVELRETHPYDLSGGEQQRLALGKVLLQEPKILLMDEPTKGLDPFFKQKLAGLLGDLKKSGVTILMVSHDIEFCAEYADRCGLFFHGEIVALDTPIQFFSGNSFYTTVANRVARQWFPKAVTVKEVAEHCAEALT